VTSQGRQADWEKGRVQSLTRWRASRGGTSRYACVEARQVQSLTRYIYSRRLPALVHATVRLVKCMASLIYTIHITPVESRAQVCAEAMQVHTDWQHVRVQSLTR